MAKVAAATLTVAAALLAGGCAQGRATAPVVSQPASTDGAVGAADAADAGQQPGQMFTACGARFRIPDQWQPAALDELHWQLTGAGGLGNGFSVSVRCIEEPASPATPFTDLAQVVAELGGEGPEYAAAFRLHTLWLESSPRRPQALIGLRQEQHEGPGRSEVVVWTDGDRRTPTSPRREHQGMLAVHWSADDPDQVRQYQAFRALIDPSFTTTSPRIGRNRATTR
ncbi:hypothetical protein [Xanthomonas sp. XNM01]|uniref:hypothetical protein n=1 Tax=Xanthomonas sp. XNM01 TaxID=2769289 RepID=UPI001782B360|nr:hypothetical protein [Xanthomonas sp. XNM01]MBD9368166.1 hypothetical protein [Xanthomonas sp. XNM01]